MAPDRFPHRLDLLPHGFSDGPMQVPKQVATLLQRTQETSASRDAQVMGAGASHVGSRRTRTTLGRIGHREPLPC
jgi:hypothetical protein